MFLLDHQTKVVCPACHDELEPACPYCQARLKKRPKAKTKCPTCGHCFFVRKNQHLFGSTILTADEVAEFDAVRQFLYTKTFSEQEYLQAKEILRRSTGSEPTPADVMRVFAPRIEKERAEREIAIALRWLGEFGVTAQNFERQRTLLRRQLGEEPDARQVKYALWDELVGKGSGSE
jgi:hypothetical protein